MPESPGYETRDISVRLAVWSAVGTLIMLAAVLAVLWLALAPRGGAPSLMAPGFFAGEGHAPGEPRLQSDPAGELQQREALVRRRLESYGWVDRQRGIVHIPIERAMDLYAQRRGEQPEAAP